MPNEYVFFNEYGNCWHDIPDNVREALSYVGDLIKVEADKCDMTEARLLWCEMVNDIHVRSCEYMIMRGIKERRQGKE